jgi:hypothetical protein
LARRAQHCSTRQLTPRMVVVAVPCVRCPARPRSNYGLRVCCRLWHVALMLPAAGVIAAPTNVVERARAAAVGQLGPSSGVRGSTQREVLGRLPKVVSTDVCPPPWCFGRLCSRALPGAWSLSENAWSFGLARGRGNGLPQVPGYLKTTASSARRLEELNKQRAAVSTPPESARSRGLACVPPHTVTPPLAF